MPYRLAPCDLGDPGWRDSWFPHGAFVASLAFWYGLVFLMFFPLFLLPYHVEMIQCYHLLHELAMNWHLSHLGSAVLFRKTSSARILIQRHKWHCALNDNI